MKKIRIPFALVVVSLLFTLKAATTVGYGSYWNLSGTPDLNINSYHWVFPVGWAGSATTNSMSAKIGQSGDKRCWNLKIRGDEIFEIFPNPTDGIFMINLHARATLEVTNALGQTIMQKQLYEGANQLDLGESATGIYFLKINQNGMTKKEKLIKN